MITLKDKYMGCIAGTWVGSAMGAAVEGWRYEDVEKEYGWLDRLLSYAHYGRDWQRLPGTTEDGIERQKLMLTAVIEKQDRINAADLVAIWKRDMDPAKVVRKQEPFDLALRDLAAAGCPHTMLGQMWPYPNVISLARGSHPIGLINAGDPEGAAADIYEVGRLYMYDNTPGLCWAAAYQAGVAAACAPDATVASVVETIRRYVSFRGPAAGLYGRYDRIAAELDRAVEIARRHSDYKALRDEFYRHYHGGGYMVYHMSQANEVVSKGVAIFIFSRGNLKEAVLNAVNFGRDTDCLAAIAAGLAGALSGAGSLPREWIEQVNEATRQDPYTNNRRTIEESVEGLHRAFLARHARLRGHVRALEGNGYLSP